MHILSEHLVSHAALVHWITAGGYIAVALLIGLESMGIPLPGETTLIAAALYAGADHQLDIVTVIAAAVAGASIGGSVGWWLGRAVGYRLLLQYGRRLRVSERHVKLGQYLFLRHGGKVVFFGRFFPILRALAGILAGANYMGWWRFCLFNIAGAIVWAATFGIGAYVLSRGARHLAGTVEYFAGGIGIAAVVGIAVFVRRHAARLEDDADRALPGPLRPPELR